MLLRVSGELQGERVDVRAIVDSESADASGIPHAVILLRLADAAVTRSDALAEARDEATTALGAGALADVVGVIANFERMNRIADATGIPLDGGSKLLSSGLRAELGLDELDHDGGSARSGRLARAVASAVAPTAFRALSAAMSVRRRLTRAKKRA